MTAPAEEVVQTPVSSGRVLHRWCMACLPEPPAVATAFCGYQTASRNTPTPPDSQKCVVCVDLGRHPCERCGQ